MKRAIAIIRRNDGFTLVELTVVLLITAVLLGTAGSVYFIAMNLYTRGENISYKTGSITNTETELQNALAIASTTGIKIDSITTGSKYAIGFDVNGDCVEVVGGNTYKIDQISKIKLTVTGKTMNYEITAKDASMSTLTGGVVMNNVTISPFGTVTLDSGTPNRYLVIT